MPQTAAVNIEADDALEDEPMVTVDDGRGGVKMVPESEAPALEPSYEDVPQGPKKHRTSLIRGKDNWDFTIVVDGIVCYCKEMSKELEEYADNGFYEKVSSELGVPLAKVKNMKNLQRVFQTDQSGDKFRRWTALDRALDMKIVQTCLVDWDDEEGNPCNQQNKKLIPRKLLKQIAVRIVADSKNGSGDSIFLASR